MIEKVMNLNYFTYKKPFSASDKGNKFKYIIRMTEDDGVKRFKVTYWTKETNSIVTKDEDKTVREFDFSDEGYEEALKWLNEECDKCDL